MKTQILHTVVQNIRALKKSEVLSFLTTEVSQAKTKTLDKTA